MFESEVLGGASPTLKTGNGESRSWVQIPPHPLFGVESLQQQSNYSAFGNPPLFPWVQTSPSEVWWPPRPGRLHHISNADKDFEQVVLVPTR